MKITNYPQLVIKCLILTLLLGSYVSLFAADDEDLDRVYALFYDKGYLDDYGNKDQKFKIKLKNPYEFHKKTSPDPGWDGKYDFGGTYEWLGYAKLDSSKLLVTYNNDAEVHEVDFN